MIKDVWERYGKPLVLAETSARGAERPVWLRYVTDEVLAALRLGVDVQGVCIFPVVDMREWKGGRVGPWGRLGLLPGPPQLLQEAGEARGAGVPGQPRNIPPATPITSPVT